MNINELQARQGNVEVEGVIAEKAEPRTFQKMGNPGKVCNAVLQDDTGKVSLTLWNDQVDQVNTGDKVKITNGYVSEWQGEKQLSTGKFGTLEVLEAGQAPKEETTPDAKPEEVPFSEEEVM